MPGLPLAGGGHSRMQPVFAGDVGTAVATAVAGIGMAIIQFLLGVDAPDEMR